LDERKQLLISIRAKATLPERPLNHVLKLETSLPRKHALPDQAADILGTYYANYDSRDRPRVSPLGLVVGRSAMKQSGNPTASSQGAKSAHSPSQGATGHSVKQPGQGAPLRNVTSFLRILNTITWDASVS
jgi:hypothetical protein